MFRIQFWKGFMKVGLRASNMYKSSFLFWKFYAFQHHFWLVTLLRQFCNAHLAAHHRQTQTDQVVARDLDSRSRNDVKFDKLHINQAKPTHSPSFWKLTKVWCISRLAWISATKTRPTDWLQRLFSPRIGWVSVTSKLIFIAQSLPADRPTCHGWMPFGTCFALFVKIR